MIKHLQKIAALALAGFAFFANIEANAQEAQYVPFSTTGALTTQTGWSNNTGTAGQLQVVEGNLSYTNFPAPEGNKVALKAADSEDAKLDLSTTVTSGSVYASFLFKPESGFLANDNPSGNYFFHFIGVNGTQTPYVSRVSIRSGSTPNTFNLGVIRVSGGTATATDVFGATPVDYAVDQTYLVVVKYDIAAQTSSIWVNPTLGNTAEPIALVTSNFGTSNLPTEGVNGVAIRQANNAGLGTGNMEIDELRVGTTWAAVTPTGTTTGIADATKGQFSIYPNPVQNQDVRLVLPEHIGAQEVNLTVSSVKGRVIFHAAGSQLQVQESLNKKMASLSKGMYFVNVVVGKEVYQIKLLKN